MQEGTDKEIALQAELDALRRDIDSVRSQMAKEHGIVPEEKEALREAIATKIFDAPRPPSPPSSPTPSSTVAPMAYVPTSTPKSGTAYLDLLSDEDAERVNDLVAGIGEHGIAKTIERAKGEDPYILDAFHDALVDKLYNDLKQAGFIK